MKWYFAICVGIALHVAAVAQTDAAAGKEEQTVAQDKVLSGLAEALRSQDAKLRFEAAEALVKMGPPGYPVLGAALQDSYDPFWGTTVESLVKIGDPAVPALLTGSSSHSGA